MITTLTLNPTLDTTLFVDALVPDDSNRVTHFQKDPGGKGLNVSRILHQLGTRVTTLTLFGGHTGNEVEDLLKKEGIYPFTIHISDDTRNNITITEERSFTQTRFNQKGPQISEEEFQSVLNMIEQVGDNANIFVISGSLPVKLRASAYKEIIDLLKVANPNLKIVLDADDEPLVQGIKAHPYMIKPNIHEAGRLLGKSINTLDDQIAALKSIRNMGASTVIISRGKDGIIGYDGQQIIEVDSIPVRVKSTVGAGDSFVAGFCYKLEGGCSFREMLEFGVIVSSAKVTMPGTSICGWDEINTITEIPVSRVLS